LKNLSALITIGHPHVCIYTYTGCFIVSDMINYLANRWFYWKIFRTKVAWLEGGTHDGNVDLTLSDLDDFVKIRSRSL